MLATPPARLSVKFHNSVWSAPTVIVGIVDQIDREGRTVYSKKDVPDGERDR